MQEAKVEGSRGCRRAISGHSSTSEWMFYDVSYLHLHLAHSCAGRFLALGSRIKSVAEMRLLGCGAHTYDGRLPFQLQCYSQYDRARSLAVATQRCEDQSICHWRQNLSNVDCRVVGSVDRVEAISLPCLSI
jgi:hypothetical protein